MKNISHFKNINMIHYEFKKAIDILKILQMVHNEY